jgi:hypothetical protein
MPEQAESRGAEPQRQVEERRVSAGRESSARSGPFRPRSRDKPASSRIRSVNAALPRNDAKCQLETSRHLGYHPRGVPPISAGVTGIAGNRRASL